MSKFKSGKIRKNSHAKIKALLSMATRIVYRTQSRGYDDCYNSNKPFVVTAEYVLEWMADDWNYRSMAVYLECDEQGNPTCLTLGGASYWQNDFIITFAPLNHEQKCEAWTMQSINVEQVEDEQPKPRIALTQVNQLLEQGFENPLHDLYKADEKEQDVSRDVKVTIKKIVVCWSESNVFNKALRNDGDDINSEVSIELYNRLEWRTLQKQKQWKIKNNESGYGYDKTKNLVSFSVDIKNVDGTYSTYECTDFEFRHDLCEAEQGLQQQLEDHINYTVQDERKEAEEAKQKAEQARANDLAKLNAYEILGVDVRSTLATIKKAYRQLAKKHHPDVDNGDLLMMQAINKAYAYASKHAPRA